jgi:hypothetical protein
VSYPIQARVVRHADLELLSGRVNADVELLTLFEDGTHRG